MGITSRLSDVLQPDKHEGSGRTAGVLRYALSAVWGHYRRSVQTATFEGQDVRRKKPEAGTVPDRLQSSSCHTHAWQTGERKNGGALLSEDASWAVLLPCELYS